MVKKKSVEICVIDSFTPETSQMRAIIMERGGIMGLEQPGPTFESLAAVPSTMRKEEEHCCHSSGFCASHGSE
jgi:hypothetical protein